MDTNRYANGKVYRLVNDVDDEIYVGSTCLPLHKRLYYHKSKARAEPNIKVYQHLNNVGFDNVSIVLIENFNCQSKEELLGRERYWIDELKPSLNKVLPLRTPKEWFQDNREKMMLKFREYNEKNKDKIQEQRKEYREANREAINKQKREHRLANIDKIKEDKKQYSLRNIEKIKENDKKYYEANCEAIKERQRQYREANRETIRQRERERRALKKAEREAQQAS
jgi:hypothetical protein